MNPNQYFDQVSTKWDTMRKTFFPDSIRDMAIRESNITAGSVVADIGAGSGFITEGLIELGVSIVAIDQSAGMIEVMKKKFSNASHIEYIQTEGDAIPLPSGSINVALANMYLHHVANPPFVIYEIYRILKPGGSLVITDLDTHTHDFLVKEQYDRWMGFDREDIRIWFATVGFNQVIVDCVGASCKSDSLHQDDVADISVFIARGTK